WRPARGGGPAGGRPAAGPPRPGPPPARPPAGNLASSLTPPHARLSLASVRTLGNRAGGGAGSDQTVHASERVPVGVPVPVVLGRVGEEIRRLLSGEPGHHRKCHVDPGGHTGRGPELPVLDPACLADPPYR